MALRRAPRSRLERVRMVIMDVDGVLTDAGMYYSESGDEWKKFNTRDGHGITLLHQAGIKTALVTRERTAIVARRALKLGLAEGYQGILDKLPVVRTLLEKHGIARAEACYIGDDLGDLDVMRFMGLAVAVGDALPAIKKVAHMVTRQKGRAGAVREVCDLILAARARAAAKGGTP